ncbi:nucleoside permease [Bacillus cytotoxicus]|uniref:nucleoside permease n=1 Tax=Bacillus cytotoxicus TaxID=580165 RepID=UPI003B7C4F27
MALLTKEHYERAAANGIGRFTLQSRVYSSGWDVEEAITTPKGMKRKSKESKYEKWLKQAVEKGMNKNTFYSRLALGLTPEEAVNMPVKKIDKFIKEMQKKALVNGVSYQTFYSRVRTYKWDPERAAMTPPINTGKRCSAH